jgi:hypothetical protein
MARIQMWKTRGPGTKDSPAVQVYDLLLNHIHDLASFTFINSCPGAWGPVPIMEAILNDKLKQRGEKPVQFILTDR